MTQEEKAKRYDKALETIKGYYQKIKYSSLSNASTDREVLKKAFPELAESEDEKIRNFISNELACLRATEGKGSDRYKELTNAIAWLERQDEQKPTIEMKSAEESLGIDSDTYNEIVDECIYGDADKVEPKFHEGGWITNNDYTWQIVNITDLDYILQSQNGHIVYDTISHVNEQFHSFTIEDAKDGDVLMANAPFIFNGNLEGGIGCPGAHCGINTLGKFQIPNYPKYWTGHTTTPATKEERDLLFQKMKEAGYEWDAEKKELRKVKKAPQKFMVGDTIKYNGTEYKITEITPNGYKVYALTYDEDAASLISFSAPAILVEQKPAWSEEDEYYYGIIQYILNNECVGKTDKENAINWFNSLKDRVLPQSKQEWSEEDEKIIKRIDSLLYSQCKIHGSEYEEIHNWLKSLRPQKHWKPSDEQMDMLAKVCSTLHLTSCENEIMESIYEALKKL